MNLSELPLFGHLRPKVWRWVLRGSGNDLAEHWLEKPNDSCLSGHGKAAAPRKKKLFPPKMKSLHVTLQSGVGEGFGEHIRRLKSSR